MVDAVSDATFEQIVLQSAEPVLVDFSAEWCGPCKAMAPALDQVAREMVGKVKVVKLDVDQNPRIKDECGIRSMPTLILFKNGAPAARHVGALVQKKVLGHWIERALAPQVAVAELPITAYRLANGMDVVVLPDRDAPTVAHVLGYRVGGADDPVGASGTAQLIEQLMFTTTAKTAAGALPPIPPRLDNQNFAFTTRDATTYLQSILPDELRACMEMEADRMANLRLTDDEVASERQVLIDKRARFGGHAMLSEQMSAALFPSHPYGIPVVGLAHELPKLSREEVLRFYRRYYVPNNAFLVVAGDVTPEEVKRLADETYAKIPVGPEVGGRSRPQQPQHVAPSRVVLKDQQARDAHFQRTYIVPSYVTAKPGEAEALALLTCILADGKIGLRVMASYAAQSLGPGFIAFYAESSDGDLAALEGALDAALDEVRQNGVTELELESATKALADQHNDRRSLVFRYALEVALGRTLAQIEGRPAALAKVTAEDIKKVANAHLDPRRSVTGWLLPEANDVAQDAQLAKAV